MMYIDKQWHISIVPVPRKMNIFLVQRKHTKYCSMVKTNKSIKQDYQRNLEKIKESRQKFSNAIKTGTWLGKGKIILGYIYTFSEIYGASPVV